MARRRFLAAVCASVGPLPWALARFSEERPTATEILRDSLNRARSLGKPLLVLRVPDDPGDYKLLRERGYDLASWLLGVSEANLRQLALCEVGTGTWAELSRLVPADPKEADGAWAVLVETGGDRFARRPIRSLRNDWRGTWGRDIGESREDFLARQEAARAHQWREMSGAVAKVLVSDQETVVQRSAQCFAALGDAEREQVESVLTGTDPIDRELADVAAAYLWRVSGDLPTDRATAIEEALLLAARERLGADSPDGTWWGEGGGCGAVKVEDYPEKSRTIWKHPCGIGHTPLMGKRFLYFYTKEPDAYWGL